MAIGLGSKEYLALVAEAFSSKGALAKSCPGFVSRPSQISFASTVAQALLESSTAVIEAGTGTGKTFGYLAPALLADSKVIISTGGKPLQDQLFEKDFPALEKAFGIKASAAVLKGRANYICLHRMHQCRVVGLPSAQCFKDLKIVENFAAVDDVGDRSNIRGVAEDSALWPFVTSNKDNCLGRKCPYANECFVNKAREKAKSSDVVIVNHHLFLSALAVRDETEADMLPKPDLVILDEAHKLPEIAIEFFGSEFSSYFFKEAIRNLKRLLMSKHRQMAPKGTSWDEICDKTVYAMLDFLEMLDKIGLFDGDSKRIRELPTLSKAAPLLKEVARRTEELVAMCESLSEDDADLEKALLLAADLATAMRVWAVALESTDAITATVDGVATVRWVARTGSEVRLTETPITFAEDFRRLRQSQPETAWVFTSATLATGQDDFSHFVNELGLDEVKTLALGSPFDYPNQSMLYVPPNMPLAKFGARDTYMKTLIDSAWPVIDLLQGRTFILCTSREAMILAGNYLRDYIAENQRNFDVYVQGEDTRSRLLANFRGNPNSILVATMSFWEGIDIKGEGLSCVVIDKIPFAPKDDPVMQAQCEWIDAHGGNAFFDHQIPLAVIALKQGVGRLIRSETDRGILIIGDKRIIPGQSRYGSRFLNSLPKASRTMQLSRVIDFWQHPDSWS